jgi:hypothetical protein
MKRIEKKRIRKPTAIGQSDIIVTAEQVLVFRVPMVKITIDWAGSGKPEYLGTGFVTIKDGAETIHTELPAGTLTQPNGDPTTWQDYFGWWYAANSDGAEVEDLPVEMAVL